MGQDQPSSPILGFPTFPHHGKHDNSTQAVFSYSHGEVKPRRVPASKFLQEEKPSLALPCSPCLVLRPHVRNSAAAFRQCRNEPGRAATSSGQGGRSQLDSGGSLAPGHRLRCHRSTARHGESSTHRTSALLFLATTVSFYIFGYIKKIKILGQLCFPDEQTHPVQLIQSPNGAESIQNTVMGKAETTEVWLKTCYR